MGAFVQLFELLFGFFLIVTHDLLDIGHLGLCFFQDLGSFLLNLELVVQSHLLNLSLQQDGFVVELFASLSLKLMVLDQSLEGPFDLMRYVHSPELRLNLLLQR